MNQESMTMAARRLAITVLPAPAKRFLLGGRDHVVHAIAETRVRLGHLGPLPSFIIIGAGKSGTTYLYDRLTEHPLVYRALVKEPHFFRHNFRKGVPWYRAHFFSPAWNRKRAAITGEASGGMFYAHAPKRVRAIVPDAKLIAILRNPIDRAYSHYLHEVRLGFETLSFDKAIEREAERVEGEMERVVNDDTYFSFALRHHAYLMKGIYWKAFETWFRYFPRDQLHIIKSEAFYTDPSKTLRETVAFLELPDWEPAQYRGHKAYPYPAMSVSTRERLAEYYAPHNSRLYEIVGTDWGWT
jgi:Sulfotransferase domain